MMCECKSPKTELRLRLVGVQKNVKQLAHQCVACRGRVGDFIKLAEHPGVHPAWNELPIAPANQTGWAF